jgi:hypothetical protein
MGNDADISYFHEWLFLVQGPGPQFYQR